MKITLSPEKPTHSNNLIIFAGSNDNIWKVKIFLDFKLTLLKGLHWKRRCIFQVSLVLYSKHISKDVCSSNDGVSKIKTAQWCSVVYVKLTKLNPPIPRWTPPSKSFLWGDCCKEDGWYVTISRQVLGWHIFTGIRSVLIIQ